MQTPHSLSDALAATLSPDQKEPVTYETAGEILAVIPHHDGEQDWLVGFRLQPTGGHRGELRPVEFAVRQVDQSASSAMTSKTIRSLPIGELLATARQAASPQHRPARKSRLTSPSDIYLAPFLEDSRGRPPRGDDAYANLALVYAGLVESGDRAPAKTIAARHGGASGTWANRIAEARRRGFLTPVKSGEAGGGLTDAATELLGIGGDDE